MLRVSVLASDGGTNLQVISGTVDHGDITNAEISIVINGNPGTHALGRARRHGTRAACASPEQFPARGTFNWAFLAKVDEYNLDLIVLAGFLVMIPAAMTEKYKGCTTNIHPSLTPSSRDVGYYGLRVHEAALARGVKVTGATVHYVDGGTDIGPIILQKAAEVEEGGTPEILQKRVIEQAEWVALPRVTDMTTNGQQHLFGSSAYHVCHAFIIRRHVMKTLIIGDDGREHTIAWKMSRSLKVEKLRCAPGDAGIAKVTERIGIGVTDFEKLVTFTGEQAIDLVVVGSDNPLAAGAVDTSEDTGIRVFGPGKSAAILEASKAFSKDLMKKHNIPPATYETFGSSEEALTYLKTTPMPIVLKADGLALGKGVFVCNTREETKEGIRAPMLDKQFGSADDRIAIEEFMTGREVSVFSFANGHTIKIMTSAQDHKRAKDRDQGLNTEGMEVFSPSLFYTDEVDALYRKYACQPTVDAMKAEDREFKGVISSGLMLTEDSSKVLEYNVRFGDPETQVVLPRMKNDTVDAFEAYVDGTLDQIELEFEGDAVACVVLTSDGYPEHYEKRHKIDGLDRFDGQDGYYVFHAGSKLDKDRNVMTNGGRVLGATAEGNTLKEVRENAYRAVEWVELGNKYTRHGIGKATDEA